MPSGLCFTGALAAAFLQPCHPALGDTVSKCTLMSVQGKSTMKVVAVCIVPVCTELVVLRC